MRSESSRRPCGSACALTGRERREVAVTLGSLGLSQHAQGDFAEGGASYESALRIYRENGIPLDHAATQTQVNLGSYACGRIVPRTPRSSFELPWRCADPSSGRITRRWPQPFRRWRSPSASRGTWTRRRFTSRRPLAIMERLYGTGSVRVIGPLITLGSISAARGEVDRAEATFRRALAVAQETLGDNSPDVARIFNDLSAILRDKGELVEAESMAGRAVSTYRTALGADHLFSAFAHHTLGTVLSAVGRRPEAEGAFQEALRIFGVNDLEEAPQSARTLTQLGSLKLEAGQPEAAEDHLRRALMIWEDQASPDSVQLASTRAYLGRSLQTQERLEESETLLLSAWESLRAMDMVPQPMTARITHWLVELYERSGRPGEAARIKGAEHST